MLTILAGLELMYFTSDAKPPLFVDGTVLREMAGYVEEVGCHIVIPVDEHSGNSQCITAVIARSGKDDDGRRAAPMVGNGLGQRLSCPLHQID